jgi:hypothetical protein
MNIIIKSTETLTEIDGVPVRLWDGITERGTRCKVFVHRIAVHNEEDHLDFERELKEELPPGHRLSLRQIL